MSRFAWLQSRYQTLTVAVLLGGLAIAAAITGVELSHLYTTEIAHCQRSCGLAANDFGNHQAFLQHALDILAMVTPALLGIFWGAPLISRELETGTYRLAWTQSVSRSRWVVTKLAMGAGLTVAVAGVLTLTITWWYRALDHVGANQYDLFDRRDITPVGYALFAFAAGALLGTLVRRVVPAMAATLAAYIGMRVAVGTWLRPHLLPPSHRTLSLLGAEGFGFMSSNGGPVTLVAKASAGGNTWSQSTRILTSGGHRATSAQLSAFIQQHCPLIANPPAAAPTVNHPVKAPGPDVAAFEACRQQAAKSFHLALTYLPAGRYWALQWLETGVFVVLAAIAMAACFWWVAKRAG
jgi:hypothetical protein